jgi:acetyl esterase/lipase
MEPSLKSITTPSKKSDLRFYYGNDKSQFADLYIPNGKGPFPVVIGIHGGWWRSEYDLSTHSHLCNWFKDHGIAAWNIEYRRVNKHRSAWPFCGEDIIKAINYLDILGSNFNLDLENCCIIGFSAGSQLATWVTHKYSADNNIINITIKKTISLAGAVDLDMCDKLQLSNYSVRDFFGIDFKPSIKLLAQACPSHLGRSTVPIHIFHGLFDTSIPACVSKSYFQKLVNNNSNCELKIFTNATHFQLIDPNSPYWPDIYDVVFSALNVTSHKLILK